MTRGPWVCVRARICMSSSFVYRYCDQYGPLWTYLFPSQVLHCNSSKIFCLAKYPHCRIPAPRDLGLSFPFYPGKSHQVIYSVNSKPVGAQSFIKKYLFGVHWLMALSQKHTVKTLNFSSSSNRKEILRLGLEWENPRLRELFQALTKLLFCSSCWIQLVFRKLRNDDLRVEEL